MFINVLYEDNHLLMVEKPINIPVQADDSKDEDLLSMLKDYIKEKYNKPGKVYLGLDIVLIDQSVVLWYLLKHPKLHLVYQMN